MSLRLGLLRSMSVEASTQKRSHTSPVEAGSTESSSRSSPAPPSRSTYSYYDCNGYEMRQECKKGVGYEFYRCRYAGHCRGRASSEKGSSVLKQTVPHNHPPKHPPESMRPKHKKRGRGQPPKPKKECMPTKAKDRVPKKSTLEGGGQTALRVAENKQNEANEEGVHTASTADSCLSSAERSGTNHSTSNSTREFSEPTEEGDSTTTAESNTITIGMELATLLENFFERTIHMDANKSTQLAPAAASAHEDHQEHPAEPTPAAMNDSAGHLEDAEELRAKVFILKNEIHDLRRAIGIGSAKASFDSPGTSSAAHNLYLQRQLESEEKARKEAEQKYKQCVKDSKKIIEERDQLQKDHDKFVAEAKRRESAAAGTSCSGAECEKKLKDAEAKSRGWEGQFLDMRRKYETLKASRSTATSTNGSAQASSNKAVEKIPETTSDAQTFKHKYEEERSLREKFQEVLANMTSQSAPAEQVDAADLKRELELIKESAADYMMRCRQAEEELARLRELKGPEVELSRRLEGAGRQLAAALAAKKRLQTALDERNAEVRGLQESISKLEAAKWTHAAELASVSRKFKEANDKREALEKDHNELKKEHAGLTEKFAKMSRDFEPMIKGRAELLRQRICLSCVERKNDKPPLTTERAAAASPSVSSHALNSAAAALPHNEANDREDRPCTSSRSYVPLRHAPPTNPFEHESPRSPSPPPPMPPSSPPSLDCYISSQAIERPLPPPRSPSPEPGASLIGHRNEPDRRLNGEKAHRKRARSSLDDSPQSSDDDRCVDDERKSRKRRKQSGPSREPLDVITLSDEDDDAPAAQAEPREEQREHEEDVAEPRRSTHSRSPAERDLRSSIKDLAERAKQLFPETFGSAERGDST